MKDKIQEIVNKEFKFSKLHKQSLKDTGDWGEEMKIKFEYEYIEKQEDVRRHIQNCEGRHRQQVAYSSFHDALTQICYGCKKIRSNLKL